MSVANIVQTTPEANFYVQQSTLSIFRYEDVIFNLFPQLTHHKRRGQTAQEIFKLHDPFFKKDAGQTEQMLQS